jgi:hypothetical protein
VIVSSD